MPSGNGAMLSANSAYVPGMGSIDMLGEHLLAAAHSTDTEAEEAAHQQGSWGRGSQCKQPQLQELAQAAQSTAEIAQANLSRCNPDFTSCSHKPATTFSTGTCKWVVSCPPLQLWQERFSQPDKEFAGVPLVCFSPFCSMKWRKNISIYVTRQWSRPSLRKMLLTYLVSAAAWCSAMANCLPLVSILAIPEGRAPSLATVVCQRGKMKPIHAMESCSPFSFPFCRWDSLQCTSSYTSMRIWEAGDRWAVLLFQLARLLL